MIELVESGVDFNQETHTYTLNGKVLQGITGIISRQLFPDKYSNVNQEVLNRAAARGSMVHEQIELVDAGIIDAETTKVPELRNYVSLMKKAGLVNLRNEYIVTDGERFASAIDLVKEHNDEIVLLDIKNTYKLDKEYLRWQLSIYAYLFELQNPELEVSELYGLWLRGEKSELAPIERIPSSVIVDLFIAEIDGVQFVNPYVPQVSGGDYPQQIIKAESALVEMESDLKELKEQKEKLMNGLLPIMVKYGIKSYKGQLITLSRKDACIRKSIDSEKLRNKHPDIYKECLKETQVKESLTLKVN